jgi:hypothetical protein
MERKNKMENKISEEMRRRKTRFYIMKWDFARNEVTKQSTKTTRIINKKY